MALLSGMRKIHVIGLLAGVLLLGAACEANSGNDIEENTNSNVEEESESIDRTDTSKDNDTNEEEGSNSSDEDDANDEDSEPKEPNNYYEELQIDGKTIDASSIRFHDEAPELIDYSDDSRTLAETGELSDTDEIDIPSGTFKDVLTSRYDLETPIVYGDVKGIERLYLAGFDIESLAGIEYFENLSVLDLSNNTRLTSIKGVEALGSLSELDISNTRVKKIDYDMPSLEKVSLKKTLVDVDETNIENLIARWPELNTLNLAQTSFKVNETIVEIWDDWSRGGALSVWLLVDYKQIEYETVGFDVFWDFEGEAFPWTRPGFNVDVPFKEDQAFISLDSESLYVDIKEPSYNETLSVALDELAMSIGVEETNDTIETTALVYDYFEEHMIISEDGSTSVLDAYNQEPITESTAFEAMALLYQSLNLPVYSDQITYSSFTDNFEARVSLLYMVCEQGRFVIGSPEYFLVGSETIKMYVEDEIIKQGYDSESQKLDLSFEHIVSEHDYSRSELSEKAKHLNIEFIFE